MPVFVKKSENNSITSVSEINLDFTLNSESDVNIYGDIDIELGSTLPQSGNVYYTVLNKKTS